MSEVKTSAIKEKSLEEMLENGHKIVIEPEGENEKSPDEEETVDEIEKYVEENEERLRRLEKHGSKIGRIIAKAFLIKGGKEL